MKWDNNFFICLIIIFFRKTIFIWIKIIISLNKKLNKGPYISSKIFKSPYNNNKKYSKDLINNPNNPYWTSWQNSFLKKGYQLGLNYKTIQFGVPSLRIKQLHKKIILPPVYKVKYNQYSDNNNELKKNDNIFNYYYNKDKTIKSLNIYLNLKEKSEAEMMKEYKKKILKELNIKESEENEEDNEEEEENDDEESKEEDDEENDEESEEESDNKDGESEDDEENEEDEEDEDN